jgi:hypothetical protein
MKNTDDSLWESTAVQNLFRYRPSGTYFARFKVGGKPIRQSLETSVFSVAKQRLPDKTSSVVEVSPNTLAIVFRLQFFRALQDASLVNVFEQPRVIPIIDVHSDEHRPWRIESFL